MKRWMIVLGAILAVGCLAQWSDASEQTSGATGQLDVLAMLKVDMPEAKITISNREYSVVVQWLTQVEAQTCQRPLDLYLADSRIGAFIHPIQNLTLKGPSLHDFARAFRLSVMGYLKKKQIHEKHVLAAKDIDGIYMKEDAEF